MGNEILNPGFETGDLTSWSNSGSVTVQNSVVAEGTWALQCGTGTSANINQSTGFVFSGGEDCKLSVWGRSDTGRTIYFEVEEKDGSFATLHNHTITWGPTETAWAQKTLEWTNDADTRRFKIEGGIQGGATGSLNGYLDGSFAGEYNIYTITVGVDEVVTADNAITVSAIYDLSVSVDEVITADNAITVSGQINGGTILPFTPTSVKDGGGVGSVIKGRGRSWKHRR